MVVKTKTRLRWCIVFRRKATQCGSDYDINSPRNCKKGKCAVHEPRVGKSQSWPVLKLRRSLYNNVAANHIFLFFCIFCFFFFGPRTINRTKQQLPRQLWGDVRESWTLSSCLRCGEKPLGLRSRSAISVSFSRPSPPSPRPLLAGYRRRALTGGGSRAGAGC